MNEQHLELCSSAEWAEAVQKWIIPWVLADIAMGEDVLEIGPGPGRTTEVLVDMVPHLTAVEIDTGLAAALSDRLAGPSLDVVRGDATVLPFESDRFTAVLSFTMLHHVPSVVDQDKVFAEACRVLRPGGIFVGTDTLDSDGFRELHVGDVCVPLDPDTLGARLEAAGFDHVHVDTNDYGVRFRATRSGPAPAGGGG